MFTFPAVIVGQVVLFVCVCVHVCVCVCLCMMSVCMRAYVHTLVHACVSVCVSEGIYPNSSLSRYAVITEQFHKQTC